MTISLRAAVTDALKELLGAEGGDGDEPSPHFDALSRGRGG